MSEVDSSEQEEGVLSDDISGEESTSGVGESGGDSSSQFEFTLPADGESVDPSTSRKKAGVPRLVRRLNGKHAQLQVALTENQRLAERIAELESQVSQGGKDQGIVIPEVPEPFDDNFVEKMKARDEAIINAAINKSKAGGDVSNSQSGSSHSVDPGVNAQREQVQRLAEDYKTRAEAFGISADALVQAGEIVNAYGIDNQTAIYMLKDPLGPAIVCYLAGNTNHLDAMSDLGVQESAVYLAEKVKPEILSTAKRKSNTTPNPPTVLNGKGTTAKSSGSVLDGLGVTYE